MVGLEQLADWRQVRVPFVRFSLYKYVVRGIEGDRRNIFHECLVCGFLSAVHELLEQQFQASLVVRRFVFRGAISIEIISTYYALLWIYAFCLRKTMFFDTYNIFFNA